jgi:mono/diheme cytochrome c family protein
MLKSSLVLFAAALLLAVFLPLRGGSQQGTAAAAATQQPVQAPIAPTQAKNPVKATAESQAKAKQLYQIDCAMCHADNGSGKSDLATSMNMTMEDWTNPASLANKTDADLFTIIRNGKDKMPPEAEGRASDTAVWNLIIYIRSFSKGQPAAPPLPPTGVSATPQ